MSDEKITYQKAGVDPEKAASILSRFGRFVKTRPRDPALLAGIGPFASCYSLRGLLGDYHDPVLVTSCDGVGTKVKLALDWNLLDGLGDDLVAMNVNDTLCVGARPLLFLDYYACGNLREEQLLPLLKSIQHGCETAGCTLAGGETAEMPGMYQAEDFDLAGFTVGIVERDAILGAEKVQAGDKLVAIASSGLHSNGYSLVRRIVEREGLKPDDRVPWEASTWREVLLAPTTIYVPLLRDRLPRLHALAHITGGGLFENLPRVFPAGLKPAVDSARWPLPPLFRWLQEKAGLSTPELLTTVNGGVGMIAVCPPAEAAPLIAALGGRNVKAWEIGSVVETPPGEAPTVLWQ